MPTSPHIKNSSYRELLIEHILIGEIMKRLWFRGITNFEVLQPQVDDSGYDLVLDANGVLRHIQLKASFRGASTSKVKVSVRLATKRNPCVVWVEFDPATFELGPFRWFGGSPKSPFPDISGFKVSRMTRGDSQGLKKERPNMRDIPKRKFTVLKDYDELLDKLFGKFPDPAAAA